jgi:diacylglycerol kinase family enzyme
VDGKLDACFFHDSNIMTRLRMFMAAFRGTHIRMPGVVAVAVSRLELKFATRPTMEMDGELRTATSPTVEVRCAPSALRVIAAPKAIL